MQHIGLLYNPLSPETARAADEIAAWLGARGVTTWRGVSHDAREDPALIAGCELLVSLGGDGTILRAARLAIPNAIPLLPIALGHLSFMAEVEPTAALTALDHILRGDWWTEERALVEIELRRAGVVEGRWTALNELLLARAEMVRAVIVEVQIDGATLTTYHADGIIVATATGSTAYALAAGGPVLDPRSSALVLASVAPHLTIIPSLVVHETAVITLRLDSHYPALLSIDGQITVPLIQHDEVVARRATRTARFARVTDGATFYATLTRKLRRV